MGKDKDVGKGKNRKRRHSTPPKENPRRTGKCQLCGEVDVLIPVNGIWACSECLEGVPID